MGRAGVEDRHTVSGRLAGAALIGLLVACGGDTSSRDAAPAATLPPRDAPRVTILEPADGAVLDGPTVRVVLSIDNLTLALAGDETPNTGHHHLFLDVEPTPPGEPIPADVPGIIHMGQAQPEFEIPNVAPGDHVLIAVIGDFLHRRIDPQITDTVRFRVR